MVSTTKEIQRSEVAIASRRQNRATMAVRKRTFNVSEFDRLQLFNPVSLSHLFSYRGVSCTSLTACQILVQCTNGDGFVPFYSGGTPSQVNLTKSQKNMPVHVQSF